MDAETEQRLIECVEELIELESLPEKLVDEILN